MKKLSILILLISSIFNHISAQELLTSEEAVGIALKNNFDILVARNDADIDKINNTAGNAGMMPSVSINGSDNFAANSVHQKNINGTESDFTSIKTNTFNAGPILSWMIFDGGKMFVTKKKLTEIEDLGELQFKDRVMQSINDVILAYYDVVRQKQQLSSINEVISFNKENVKILEVSFGAGLTPKTNLLQAKIDLNVYQENAINQKAIIIATKRTLNGLLARETDANFEVIDSIPLNYIPDPTVLTQKLYLSNTSVLTAQKQVDIAQLFVKENKSLMFPKINVNVGYNFLRNDNPAGPITFNKTTGAQLGGSINIPIFQGGNANRQIKTSKIQLQNAQYGFEDVKLQINMQLQNALTIFNNQKQLLIIEKSNAVLAKENLEISLQRLRYGQTTTLEVHLAQDSYVQSLTRLLNFEYNLKVAETKLKQLMSEL